MARGPFAFLADNRTPTADELFRSVTGRGVASVREAVAHDFELDDGDGPDPDDLPGRTGYLWGIPKGGTGPNKKGTWQKQRRELLEDMALLYETCIWVSANCDRIAAAVTAGGLAIRINGHKTDDSTPPPEVMGLLSLFELCNPDQNIIQLLTELARDLVHYGDAYCEIQFVMGWPTALYMLDSPSMSIDADDHGKITGYTQKIDSTRTAHFEPEQVLHWKLPGRGLYGQSPTRKCINSAKTWVWAQATLNERMRQGDPETLHVDLPEDMAGPAMKRWFRRFMMTNRGTKSVGTPIVTRGGGHVNPIGTGSVERLLKTKDKCRDEMVSEYGTPPNKVGIIESGNLGGGTGESQDKTWKYDITKPIQDLLLEGLQYALVKRGFGITGYHLEIPQVDMRDSETIEKIRDMRLRNASLSLNGYLQEAGEQGIGEAGDVRVLIDRGNIVMWQDVPAYTQAEVLNKAPNLKVLRDQDGILQVEQVMPIAPQPAAYLVNPVDQPEPDAAVPAGEEPPETEMARQARVLAEAAQRAFLHRRKRTLKELPPT